MQQQQRTGAVLDAYSTLATGLNTRQKLSLAKQSFQRKMSHNLQPRERCTTGQSFTPQPRCCLLRRSRRQSAGRWTALRRLAAPGSGSGRQVTSDTGMSVVARCLLPHLTATEAEFCRQTPITTATPLEVVRPSKCTAPRPASPPHHAALTRTRLSAAATSAALPTPAPSFFASSILTPANSIPLHIGKVRQR